MNVKRWLGGVSGLALAVAAVLTATPVAHATTPNPTVCSNYTCDRTEPTTTVNPSLQGCSVGAWTVVSTPFYGGLLEQRWGPNCSTNWTRFIPGNNDEYEIWVDSHGVVAGAGTTGNPFDFSHDQGVAVWSSQVYSPGPAESCVWDVTDGGAHKTCIHSI
jgi:hypothetical protein